MIRNLLKLLVYPLAGNIRTKPKTPSAPLKSDALNVFAGQFTSELSATDYAMGLGDTGSLSADLAGATIGPDDVEVIFGADRIAATRPMLHFRGRRRDTGDTNTLILLSDRGYDGDAATGKTVTFLGICSVS